MAQTRGSEFGGLASNRNGPNAQVREADTGGGHIFGTHSPTSVAKSMCSRFSERLLSQKKTESDLRRHLNPWFPHVTVHTQTRILSHTHTHTSTAERQREIRNTRTRNPEPPPIFDLNVCGS